ncbi:MAG: hypothetical protein G3M70_09610 [Candidatus Nitronauta litoralis]|uniref:Uncharacterized protein n=1 Tax=Candidatus Nitronauta litoralis TaxID=2705533 RepID=A0A7T0BW93_9BACT|nr:MAG: hypothetical protein G3M70_09610 [Candidatus Nitronauta litoralis]
MSEAPNPILVEFAEGIPDSALSKKLVDKNAPYREISKQARKEWELIAPLVESEEPPTKELVAMGYEEWFNDAVPEDRTRMLGRLDMLYEMTLDLAEEEEEDEEG